MRLDLYLKASRLVKRRAVAKELCDSGRVFVNSRPAQPSKEVRQGDAVMIQFAARRVEIEVVSLPARAMKTGGDACYRVLSERRIENGSNAWTTNPS